MLKPKQNCLNDYVASISTVNDEHTQLSPFTKLTDNSLSHINYTEHEIETTIEVLNTKKQLVMVAYFIKCSRVSPNLFLNHYVF